MANTDYNHLINSGKYLAYYCLVDFDGCIEEVERVVKPSCQSDIDAIPIAVWNKGLEHFIFDDIESVGLYLKTELSQFPKDFCMGYDFHNLSRGEKDYLWDIVAPYNK